jgi:electron transfer flavoprotein-quinone oxidoreductase
MGDDFAECIVVGAGPAGSAAALALAKSRVDVHVLERGHAVGAKNVSGAILNANTLSHLIPGFRAEAPLERRVARQRYSLLTGDAEMGVFDLHTSQSKHPPLHNLFAVNRRAFDKWFADQAIKVGATYHTGIRADRLIQDSHGVVIGVETSQGALHANVVILTDGANSILNRHNGRSKHSQVSKMWLGVKETIRLPIGKIEDRFNLERNEGASFKYLGEPVQYSPGTAFILTNNETLSVGVITRLSDLSDKGARPYELLDAFKNHPWIRRLLEGGVSEEYSAHILPEMGYGHLPPLTGDGFLVAGDAAGLLSALFHEGMNLALASGLMSGLAAAEASKHGKYSNNVLGIYRKMLHQSFVMQDMKTASKFHELMEEKPEYFNELLKATVQFATDVTSITDKPDKEQISRAWHEFTATTGRGTLAKEAFRLWRFLR